jgi:NADH-quinone oxidoreductase subunit J
MLESAVGPVFWILAFVVLISGMMVVSLRNIFHCALMLIVCLSGVAGIYVLLHAEFLAAVQVLIYVGAVSILIIFAVMLTSHLASRKITQTNQHALATGLASAVFFCWMLFLLWNMYDSKIWGVSDLPMPQNNVESIGRLLMTDYMLPFEVISVLMLAALIGAIVLAREERT